MDVKMMYKRYKQLSWQQQLGNLASTLSRIATQVTSPDSDKLVAESLREAALLIEWSAPNVPPDFLPELAAMQREMLAWHQAWPIPNTGALLALHTRNQSDRLLQMAGLLDSCPQQANILETAEATT